jgi:hypothetical protein
MIGRTRARGQNGSAATRPVPAGYIAVGRGQRTVLSLKDLQPRGLQRLVTAGLPRADVAGGGVVLGASTVQAWRVGEERAETYLRLLAEVELGRTGDQLHGLDAAAGTDAWSDPGVEHATAERALWRSSGPGGSSSRPACSTTIALPGSRMIFIRPSRPGHGSC